MKSHRQEKPSHLSQKEISLALDAIEQKHGTLTPAAVVQEASKPSHVLHQKFDWDDRTAAYSQRLNVARAIIRSVRVVMQYESVRLSHVTYVHDPKAAPGQQGYEQVVRLKTEQELALEALDAEIDRAVGALHRAREIAVALGSDDVERIAAAIRELGR